MSDIELSSRGKRQLKSILHTELKETIDELIKPIIKRTIENRVNKYVTNSIMERLVKTQIKDIYWKIIDEMLQKADFQTKLKEEIITYLHKRWACGITPFEEQFDDALLKAVKTLIGGKR